MLSYRAVLTRNGLLRNSTTNLATREGHLQHVTSLLLNTRSFKSLSLAAKELLPEKKSITLINISPLTSRLKYINDRNVKHLCIKNFHTNPSANYVNLKDFDQNSHATSAKSTPVINCKELLNDDDEGLSSTTKSHHHHHKDKYTLKDIEKIYPLPRSTLNEIFTRVTTELKRNCLSVDFKSPMTKRDSWICTVKITWPDSVSFSAAGKNKMGASNLASLKCLQWLENQHRIKNGIPQIYSQAEIKEKLNEPVHLSLSKQTLNDAKALLDKFNENVASIMADSKSTHNYEFEVAEQRGIIDPVGRALPVNRSPENVKYRNELLKKRLEHRQNSESPSVNLPIMEYRDYIVDEINKNQVLVIKGDTGCGKTTQVPQFIMDSFTQRGQASDCNIIVSQPRRISAISLAERVADERHEQVGDVVGYQVRLAQELPNTPAGILFCTAGLLLRKLQFNPNLEGCSHVIVDEAHERKIDIDLLLALLKRAMTKNTNLKIVIMSATINAELFQNYFNCNVIEVPGRTYPVEMKFLEDIEKIGLRTPTKHDLTFDDANVAIGPAVDIPKMGALVSWITRNQAPGAILCFLPGWAEISKMQKYLEEYARLSPREVMIVPVHSKMSHYDQRKIFSKTPRHVRKIVLATDIAETGITVADVVYVVDSCMQRQVVWNENRGVAAIENFWASQANIMQRKGRAGRVKPGMSYHMISKEIFNSLAPYPTPEIRTSALEKTVLDAKTYSNEKAADFLGTLPEPPNAFVIDRAVEDLANLGALNANEDLTPLGKRIALFTCHPRLSKAMVYSSIFQCVGPIVTIASLMSSESEVFTDVLYNKTQMRNVKSKYHPSSDHVSMAWLFQQWKAYNDSSRDEAKHFSRQNGLHAERMYTLSKVRQLNAEHLYYAKMIEDKYNFENIKSQVNEYSELDELVRGVLMSGLDHVLHMRNFDRKKNQWKSGQQTFIMNDGNRATITPDSVNYKRTHWPSPYLTYVRSTHHEERRSTLIRDTSLISPLTVLLFGQSQIFGFIQAAESKGEVATEKKSPMVLCTMKNRSNIRIICEQEVADVLLPFRDVMWSIVRYLVTNYGAVGEENTKELGIVETYKNEMLEVIAKMLNEASLEIDRPSQENNNDKTTEESTTNQNDDVLE